MNTITTQFVNIEDIILLDENPRQIADTELQQLAKDIKDDPNYLIQRPPLLNLVKGKLYCYAGTQRIKASALNGETKVPAFIEENVPKKIQDKRMVVDNLHRGHWDEEKLLELDFELGELEEFGFKDFEVSIFTDVKEPTNLTAEMKDAPPTLKLTFENVPQMEAFEVKLKDLIQMNDKFSTITYSVSAGEM